ncbi:MAG: hypothetical protein IPM11_14580 [Micropruina sp.]|nr:hypothetical protein [Micropruina sp.]
MDGMLAVKWLENDAAWTFRRPSDTVRERLGATFDGSCGRFSVRGVGGGLPEEARLSFVGVELEKRTVIVAKGGHRLSLEGLTVDAASCRRPAPKPQSVEALWELTVSGPDGVRWTIRGPWLVLAYLGALAGWPEPTEQPPAWKALPIAEDNRDLEVAELAWNPLPEAAWRQVGRDALWGLAGVPFSLAFPVLLTVMGRLSAGALLRDAWVYALFGWVPGFVMARHMSSWGPVSRLGTVKLSGRGGGLPESSSTWWLPVDVGSTQASLALEGTQIVLPLAKVRPVAARRVGLPRLRTRAADAVWELDVAGPAIRWTIRGPWIRLAQLAQLGDWWEPTPGAFDPATLELPGSYEQYPDA